VYGFSEKEWKRICTNLDLDDIYIEVYIKSKGGEAKVAMRKKFFEELGHEVIPYEDVGVSVGIFILKKEGTG
jgi:hypothetical protein